MTSHLVVDASAVLSLLLDPGTTGEHVGRRLMSSDVAAPELLGFEVQNVLRRRRNAGLLSWGEARLALDSWHLLPVESWPYPVLAERIWALGGNLTSYDAAYVALAEHLGCPLLTVDARLSAAPGIACEVELL